MDTNLESLLMDTKKVNGAIPLINVKVPSLRCSDTFTRCLMDWSKFISRTLHTETWSLRTSSYQRKASLRSVISGAARYSTPMARTHLISFLATIEHLNWFFAWPTTLPLWTYGLRDAFWLSYWRWDRFLGARPKEINCLPFLELWARFPRKNWKNTSLGFLLTLSFLTPLAGLKNWTWNKRLNTWWIRFRLDCWSICLISCWPTCLKKEPLPRKPWLILSLIRLGEICRRSLTKKKESKREISQRRAKRYKKP